MEIEKFKKIKTWLFPKFDFLSSHVFQNAKCFKKNPEVVNYA